MAQALLALVTYMGDVDGVLAPGFSLAHSQLLGALGSETASRHSLSHFPFSWSHCLLFQRINETLIVGCEIILK